ncbi:MAG: hypothetical protein E6H06_18840 [Bacteroidetes bacterium]|nr:MAG: hypothetical protein E6H06_18840 [Bacteroidota bacterium]
MKPTTSKRLRTLVRATLIASVLLGSVITIVSFTAKKFADDVWKQLGMTEKQAKEDINYSFLSGYLNYYGARDIKNILVGDRAAIVSNILAYTKEYITSPAFEKEYLQDREREKSKIYPVVPAITKEELTRKKIADAETNINLFENLLKAATDPTVIKSHKEQLEFWKKAIEDYKSPNCNQINYELQMDENRFKSEKDMYDQLMKKWETNYPPSTTQFVKQRIVNFLEATTGIDYSAALLDKNGKKIFVNPVYEKKNWKWKMGFRAGKEATETAREFAGKWIKEL